jgi:hypothetical protein
VLGASWSLVGALEIPDEGLSKVSPIMHGSSWQVLELGSCPLREVDGEELDDEEAVFNSCHATCEALIF